MATDPAAARRPAKPGPAEAAAAEGATGGTEIGRRRQRALVALGHQGPFTIGMAAPIYGSDAEKARVAVWQAVARGLLAHLGEFYLSEIGAKKAQVFIAAGVRVKKNWVVHDTMLHRWRLTVPNADVVLGYDCDPAFRADGEGVFSNGIEAVIEMDRQTESVAMVLTRLAVHKGHDRDIFFLTLSESRIRKVRLRLTGDPDFRDRLWFGVWYDQVRQREHAWQDIAGEHFVLYPAGG